MENCSSFTLGGSLLSSFLHSGVESNASFSDGRGGVAGEMRRK